MSDPLLDEVDVARRSLSSRYKLRNLILFGPNSESNVLGSAV